MPVRTFVVTVSDRPARVIVEDVRSRTHALADDVDAVGRAIARLLEASAGEPLPWPVTAENGVTGVTHSPPPNDPPAG